MVVVADGLGLECWAVSLFERRVGLRAVSNPVPRRTMDSVVPLGNTEQACSQEMRTHRQYQESGDESLLSFADGLSPHPCIFCLVHVS